MQEHDTKSKRKTLDPKLDIVFWMLFGAEQNRELLISLLNAVLRPEVPIESVEVLPTQPERLAIGDKSISLDVRVRLQNGAQIDVEMQSQRRPALCERALYYWARMYTGPTAARRSVYRFAALLRRVDHQLRPAFERAISFDISSPRAPRPRALDGASRIAPAGAV